MMNSILKIRSKSASLKNTTGSGHILLPFIIGAGWGTDTKVLLQRFLVGMRDHFGDAERGTSMYKIFLNALVATSWKAFAGDVSSRGMQLNYIRRNII